MNGLGQVEQKRDGVSQTASRSDAMSSYCVCGHAGAGRAVCWVWQMAVRTSFTAGICGDWDGEEARGWHLTRCLGSVQARLLLLTTGGRIDS